MSWVVLNVIGVVTMLSSVLGAIVSIHYIVKSNDKKLQWVAALCGCLVVFGFGFNMQTLWPSEGKYVRNKNLSVGVNHVKYPRPFKNPPRFYFVPFDREANIRVLKVYEDMAVLSSSKDCVIEYTAEGLF